MLFCKFFFYGDNPRGGAFSLMKANLTTVPVFPSWRPYFIFGFILKRWSVDEPELSTIASDVGNKQRIKSWNKVLADSLFFSTNYLRKQMMNSLWAEFSSCNSTFISQENLCECLYSSSSYSTSSPIMSAN